MRLARPSRPRGGGASTSQGHARTVFRRALERGNLLVAEATAKEIGRISLAEALELTLLIAQKDPRRHPRVGARWLLRYLEERPEATITEAVMVAGCLDGLASSRYEEAARTLRQYRSRTNTTRFEALPASRLPARADTPPAGGDLNLA